jgi:tripartite-type tricarboxylate transporter receptor subunit TctC
MNLRKYRLCVLIAAFAAVLTISGPTAQAGELWPQRTVCVIVPFSAGTDAPARAFAEQLAKRWKQPVVVENRPGAEGLIGVAAFTGTRDDHTLLYYSAAAITTLPITHAKLPYDPVRDIVPISSAVDAAITIAVPESLKIGSLAELVTLARAQPGKLNYYPVSGGSFMIVLPGFLKSEGLDMVQVSYREASLGLQDAVVGRVHVLMSSLATALPLVRSGKLRLLAVTNKRRAPLMPEVPTAIEAGYPKLTFDGLQGFFGPRDMPVERRARIAAEIRAVATDPAVGDPLATIGLVARGSTPDEFAAAIQEQRADLAALAKLIDMKPGQ